MFSASGLDLSLVAPWQAQSESLASECSVLQLGLDATQEARVQLQMGGDTKRSRGGKGMGREMEG